MKEISPKMNPKEFEPIGHEVRHECGNDAEAEGRCALYIHAYMHSLESERARIKTAIEDLSAKREALRAYLYDRAVPVSDADMLARRRKIKRVTILAFGAGLLGAAGNIVIFDYFGYGAIASLAFATLMTVAPLLAGYKLHEAMYTRFRNFELLSTSVALLLLVAGIVEFASARRMMFEKADIATPVSSYVDEGAVSDPQEVAPPTQTGDSEREIEHMKGMAFLWMALGADLMLGLFVGEREYLSTGPDYVSWNELGSVNQELDLYAEHQTELNSRIEAAKKWCMAGILRARNELNRRKPPYHHAIIPGAVLLFCVLTAHSYGQHIESKSAVLIDQSASIGRGKINHDLFHEYLNSVRQLLLSEPPNTEVSVSLISTDSFGGVKDLVKGWTPEARGVFTDNLNRARRQLAAAFDAKTAALSATATGTDIFGALWHVKIEFESQPGVHDDSSKEIWIFSDMVNETTGFPMPQLWATGSEQMMTRANETKLIVPLANYRIHVLGASTAGLTPRQWMTIRRFWGMYFATAGAELNMYSPECDVQRKGLEDR